MSRSPVRWLPVPALIHLNGSSGIGKSTLAALYADRHPGVLNLDTDQILPLIGGWRDDFWAALNVARRLAVAMAGTHLASGHDVVMPQLVTDVSEVVEFEAAARANGAGYREIVLTAARDAALDRFAGRAGSGDLAAHRYIDEVVAQHGGPALLTKIHRQLTEFAASRPDCVVIDTDGQATERTYAAVLAALA